MQNAAQQTTARHGLVEGVHGIRYQVRDVARSAAFYTEHLGFTLKHQQLPAFANVSLGGTDLLLSGPGASGSRPMPDGQAQAPGGWNRVMLTVPDIAAEVARLKAAGVNFRGEPVTGPAGTLAILDDPSGNPIELWQPAAH